MAGAGAATSQSRSAELEAEYLDPEQVKVNGALPFETSTALLVEQLGKPGRIEKGAIECGGYFETPHTDPSDAVWYCYGETRFEVYGPRAVLGSVDFRSGTLSVTVAGTTLNSASTLQDLRRVLPRSVAQVDNHWERNGVIYQAVSVRPGRQADDMWHFLFLDGKLVELEYYIPC